MKAIANTILVLASFVPFTASAEYSDLYIVPAAGHVQGAHGTAWRTDVVLHNIQRVPLSVQLALVESGRSPAAEPVPLGATAIVLMPGETRTLSDVAGTLGRDAAGALIAGAGLPFVVTSRTWAELPAGRTLGQNVAPVAITSTADAVHDTAVLPSLIINAQQRSNVGLFVAASQTPLIVEVSLSSPDGTPLGSQQLVVNEPGLVHQQFAIAPAVTSVTATIRIREGDGIVIPYSSTIDNATAQAFFVPGPPVSASGGAAAQTMLTRAVRAARD